MIIYGFHLTECIYLRFGSRVCSGVDVLMPPRFSATICFMSVSMSMSISMAISMSIPMSIYVSISMSMSMSVLMSVSMSILTYLN